MADETLASYRARYTEVEQRLDAAAQASAGSLDEQSRTAMKGEIIGLFKAVEQQVAEMTALKDEIKKLVDKWKTLPSKGVATVVVSILRVMRCIGVRTQRSWISAWQKAHATLPA